MSATNDELTVKGLVDLLHTAASINRDYLNTVHQSHRNDGTFNYIERFQAAARMIEEGRFAGRAGSVPEFTGGSDHDTQTPATCPLGR